MSGRMDLTSTNLRDTDRPNSAWSHQQRNDYANMHNPNHPSYVGPRGTVPRTNFTPSTSGFQNRGGQSYRDGQSNHGGQSNGSGQSNRGGQGNRGGQSNRGGHGNGNQNAVAEVSESGWDWAAMAWAVTKGIATLYDTYQKHKAQNERAQRFNSRGRGRGRGRGGF